VEAGERYCYQVTTVDFHGRESVPSAEMCVDVPQPWRKNPHGPFPAPTETCWHCVCPGV